MSRRRVSNPLALAVLGCLSERPMHPYEISTTLRTRGKEQSIKLNYGSLYAVVESLQKHGLIRAQETTREGRRPERTVYAITEAGVERVRGLAGRAAVDAGARLHVARGGTVADARAPAGRGRPAAGGTRRAAPDRAALTRRDVRRDGGERPARALPDREPVSPAHARRRARLRLDARRGHPDRAASPGPRPGDACTNSGPRACRSRRSSPIRWPTSERRRERWHPTGPPLGGSPRAEPLSGAATPDRGPNTRAEPRAAHPEAHSHDRRTGSAPPHRMGAPMSAPPTHLRADDLVKTYRVGRGRPPVRALDGLSLDIEPGTIFALLGPNGAGKSTTVRILTTLSRPDSGTATVAGIDVRTDPDAVRRVIGLVSQKPSGDPMATGRENLVLAARIQGLSAAAAHARGGELLDRFGLTDAADRLVKTWSGGMSRKLDVALGSRPSPARAVPRRADHRAGPGGAGGDVVGDQRARSRRAGHRPVDDALPRRGRPHGRPARDRRQGAHRRRRNAGRAQARAARRHGPGGAHRCHGRGRCRRAGPGARPGRTRRGRDDGPRAGGQGRHRRPRRPRRPRRRRPHRRSR